MFLENAIIVAGDTVVDGMRMLRNARVQHNGTGYDSEQLCELQQTEASRGILGAEIVLSNYGYSVRYDSGLQNWGIIAGCRSGELDGTIEAAETYARKWVAQAPSQRYAWRRP